VNFYRFILSTQNKVQGTQGEDAELYHVGLPGPGRGQPGH